MAAEPIEMIHEREISDADRKEWADKGLEIDPDSGLPIGTIIRNHKGEYGVIGRNKVIRVSAVRAQELIEHSGDGK